MDLRSKGVGSWLSKGFRLFAFPAKKKTQTAIGTEFLTMTDERAIIKLGLKTGAGSSHGKSPFTTL